MAQQFDLLFVETLHRAALAFIHTIHRLVYAGSLSFSAI